MNELGFKVRLKGALGEVELHYERNKVSIQTGTIPAKDVLDMAITAYKALGEQ